MPETSSLPLHEQAADALRAGEYPAIDAWLLPESVRSLCDAIDRPPNALTVQQAAKASKTLNDHLHYSLTLELSAAWNQGERFDLRIARLRAQALINLRRLDDAETLIVEALERKPSPTAPITAETTLVETRELKGLRARIAKDRYVREVERRPDPDDDDGSHDRERALLDTAIDSVRALYVRDTGAWWPGVNLIALLARRARDAGAADCADATAIALEVFAEVRKRLAQHRDDRVSLDDEQRQIRRDGRPDGDWKHKDGIWKKADAGAHWLLASASEACLAMPRGCRDAELWLYRFINDPRTTPFDLASYERQLREIWQGVDDETSRYCPSRLVTIVARHLRKATQSVTLSAQRARALRADEQGLEKNFSGDAQFSVGKIREMLGLCLSIGRVRRRDGDFVGTGFLVDLKSLAPQCDSELVFVTNAHVISPDVRDAARPSQAEITFELADAKQGPAYYTVTDLLFYSPPGLVGERLPTPDRLDICIVRLDPPPRGFTGLAITSTMPSRDARTRAYVIGHPRARPMQVSLHDSALLDYDELPRLIHYRTPTEPGSSGSPVFDETWQVIAVHHAGRTDTRRLHGDGRYEANEGVTLAALCAGLARDGIRLNPSTVSLPNNSAPTAP